jgi:hypothetical protein
MKSMRYLPLFVLGLIAAAPAVARADADAQAPSTADSDTSHRRSSEPASGYIVPRAVAYEGGEIPSNSHIELRPNLAFVATGASIFGSAYIGALIYGLSTCSAQETCRRGSGWLYLPLAGPFVTSAQAPTTGGQALAAFDGGLQVLGAALTVVGFVAPKKFVVWQNKSATMTLSPSLPSTAGGSASAGDGKPAMSAGVSLKITNF